MNDRKPHKSYTYPDFFNAQNIVENRTGLSQKSVYTVHRVISLLAVERINL